MRILAVKLAVIYGAFVVLQVAGRTVNVDVKAPWSHHSVSFISEYSEFLFDRSPEYFWKYVDNICLHSEKIESVIANPSSDDINQLQSIAYETAISHTPKSFHSLMDTMIGLGHYLPTIQFFQSTAEKFGNPCSGGPFIVLYPGEAVICDVPDNLSSLFDRSEGAKRDSVGSDPEWEHVFVKSSNISADSSAPAASLAPVPLSADHKAVLYGIIGTKAFCSLHSTLSHHPEVSGAGPSVQYIMRHAFFTDKNTVATAGTSETRLQGFGVFLDIKNMEYKNVDDSETEKKEGDGSSNIDGENKETAAVKDISFDPEEEVQGINFSVLQSTLPTESAADLSVLREELLKIEAETSGSGDMADMKLKIWKIKDLGLQTMQLISSTNTQNTVVHAIQKFTDISQNFPKLASMVSTTKVTAGVRKDVESLYNSGILQQIPGNSVFINGKRTDLSGNTFNIYDLLDEIKEELLIQNKLESMKLDKKIKKQLVSVATSMDGASGAAGGVATNRVDISKGGKYVVNFLNNLEKDKQYKQWPRSLKQLLYPSWSLHTVAKNMYTLVSVVDILSVEGASLAMQVNMLLQQYPIRFGMVYSCADKPLPSGTVSSAATDLAVSSATGGSTTTNSDFCRLYAHLQEQHDQSYATTFLFAVAELVLEIEQAKAESDEFSGAGAATGTSAATGVTTDMIIELYTNTVATLSNSWTTSSFTTEAEKVVAQKQHEDFIRNSTLYLEARGLPVNSFSINGIVVNDFNMQSSLMQILSREQYMVTQLYQAKTITDKTKSIFSVIMEENKASTRYHPMVSEKDIVYADFNTAAGDELLSKLRFMNPLLSQDLTADALQYYTFASTTLLSIPLTREGYQAATTAIEWLMQNAEGIEWLDGHNNHRLAIIHQLPAVESEDAASSVCAVTSSDGTCTATSNGVSESFLAMHLLNTVQQGMSIEFGESKKDTVKECDMQCLKALAVVYKELENNTPVSSIVVTLTAHLSTLSDLDAGRVAVTLRRLKKVIAVEGGAAAADVESAVQNSVAQAQTIERLARELFKYDADSNEIVVVYNGRKLVVPVTEGKRPLHELDLGLMASLERDRLTSALIPLIDTVRTTSDGSTASTAASVFDSSPYTVAHNYETHSNMLVKLSSYCGYYNSLSGKRFDVDGPLGSLAASGQGFDSLLYDLEPDVSNFMDNSGDLKIFYLVDPLSLAGQRAASLIKLVRDHLHYSQTILFAPRNDLTAFPLQNFYRYVVSPHESDKAVASFGALPTQHVLTVRVDIPEPWNVQAKTAMQDIDNLRCIGKVCGDPVSTSNKDSKDESARKTDLTEISYALKNLLVAGQCFQSVPGDTTGVKVGLPPNGLQLTLTPAQSYLAYLNNEQSVPKDQTDTLVMQNLGYFQLQANPGLFVLNLAEGRATDLYTIKKSESFGGKFVAVRSFKDSVHRLIVNKREGMEHIPLLEADNTEDAMARNNIYGGGASSSGVEESGKKDKSAGFFGNLKSSLFGNSDADKKAKAVKAADGEDDRIHIFSLATGHMYERLLRIMMLSVTRHSSKPVKFWLFENYLSPTFKQMAEVMAKEYGFEVAYVTYKWPQWLTQQTQQQRIIWGYKILFLDVLFPLNVKKVIYVDADQVVRADLKELWDLDLHGKPYAYTPFCDSREETLGFQFWRHGYWKDHLQGKPYHISALYVVDLQKFRKHAVGDSLRSVYDSLSRDPNSLANLDQDLPNYAQHQVPIHSLPQEWLWCESWCSDKSKATAKTIDLCNNPLHKEPKLDMARRVISGGLFNQSWVELDDEIRSLERKQGFMQHINE